LSIVSGTSKENIPVFILAGGMGTRLSEETSLRPKPMVEIGGVPILLHIMRWYYSFGFNNFVICVGYRSWDIKEYFLTYEYRRNHLRIDHREETSAPPVVVGKNLEQERWQVNIIDTGVETMTGARLARAIDEVSQAQSFNHFALTYGDGVANVDLDEELEFHLEHERIGTVLGVPPLARFGELDITSTNQVEGFLEKPEARQGQINGGFFFFQRGFRQYLDTNADCILERSPLSRLATDGQLMVFKHTGFWHAMDTLRDKNYLEEIWDGGQAPWRVRSPLTPNRPGPKSPSPSAERVGH